MIPPVILQDFLDGCSKMKKIPLILLILIFASNATSAIQSEGVRLKDLCRIVTVRDNSLIGYGIVAGLAGTGDSIRSKATTQSVANTLENLGLTISPKDINSRNVAAVMVTTTLPAFSRSGDKLDVNVTSIGDARSLLGGTLLLTHLVGANGKTYALTQGPLSIGGYVYDANGNVVQKNHATTGQIPNGATVEVETRTELLNSNGDVVLKLDEPDFTTASRVKSVLNNAFPGDLVRAIDAGMVSIKVPKNYKSDVIAFITKIESLKITPDEKAKVIINERTGTVVSGGDVTVSNVTITHGDLKLSVVTDYQPSQPFLVSDTGPGVKSLVVPDTKIDVVESGPVSLSLKGQTSVADLIAELNKVKTSSRDIITIMQTIKQAGALHAELIIE